jgi:hypothetical protein
LETTETYTTIAFEIPETASGFNILAETVIPEFHIVAFIFALAIGSLTGWITVSRKYQFLNGYFR